MGRPTTKQDLDAQTSVDRCRAELDHMEGYVQRMRDGLYSKHGVTGPDQEDLERLFLLETRWKLAEQAQSEIKRKDYRRETV